LQLSVLEVKYIPFSIFLASLQLKVIKIADTPLKNKLFAGTIVVAKISHRDIKNKSIYHPNFICACSSERLFILHFAASAESAFSTAIIVMVIIMAHAAHSAGIKNHGLIKSHVLLHIGECYYNNLRPLALHKKTRKK